MHEVRGCLLRVIISYFQIVSEPISRRTLFQPTESTHVKPNYRLYVLSHENLTEMDRRNGTYPPSHPTDWNLSVQSSNPDSSDLLLLDIFGNMGFRFLFVECHA
jgi:hypothetical protein